MIGAKRGLALIELIRSSLSLFECAEQVEYLRFEAATRSGNFTISSVVMLSICGFNGLIAISKHFHAVLQCHSSNHRQPLS